MCCFMLLAQVMSCVSFEFCKCRWSQMPTGLWLCDEDTVTLGSGTTTSLHSYVLTSVEAPFPNTVAFWDARGWDCRLYLVRWHRWTCMMLWPTVPATVSEFLLAAERLQTFWALFAQSKSLKIKLQIKMGSQTDLLIFCSPYVKAWNIAKNSNSLFNEVGS